MLSLNKSVLEELTKPKSLMTPVSKVLRCLCKCYKCFPDIDHLFIIFGCMEDFMKKSLSPLLSVNLLVFGVTCVWSVQQDYSI